MKPRTLLFTPIFIFACSLLIAACTAGRNNSTPTTTLTTTQVSSPSPMPLTPTLTPEPSKTPTITPVPPTATITNTPTPKQVFNEPGSLLAPILLYHHVEGENFTNRYTVSIPDFRDQMQALEEMGYTPISMSLFLDALLNGAEIPEKPIVITFDDGHESVYENAFPIMKGHNFIGIFYIVANRLNNVDDFVNVQQVKELINSGWEVGSHSFSHADLTKNHSSLDKEVGDSKNLLESSLATDVQTFAYPFGTIDSFSAKKVSDYLYRAGMGLGINKTHTLNNLFYLERIEIYGTYSLDEFKMLVSRN